MGFASGSSSLIIRSQNKLNFTEINKNLRLEPSKTHKKGDFFSKSSGEIQNDVWIYELKMKNDEEPNAKLCELLNAIQPSKGYIESISDFADICIRCYVQSELAQIGFNILPEVLKQLADLNVRLELSILSWGGVETDAEEAES